MCAEHKNIRPLSFVPMFVMISIMISFCCEAAHGTSILFHVFILWLVPKVNSNCCYVGRFSVLAVTESLEISSRPTILL